MVAPFTFFALILTLTALTSQNHAHSECGKTQHIYIYQTHIASRTRAGMFKHIVKHSTFSIANKKTSILLCDREHPLLTAYPPPMDGAPFL